MALSAGGESSMVMAAVQRAPSGRGPPLNWELTKLYQSRRLSMTTTLYDGGVLSPTPLANGGSVGFLRVFHVESFRGGMNRLLLRAMPTEENSERVEVLFQYVQRVDLPMRFEGLTIEDATESDGAEDPWSVVLAQYPECRVYRLVSGERIVGRVAASACVYGQGEEPIGAPSMFPMMG